MNKPAIFNHPQFGDLRIVDRDGKPWFVAKDVALALGYAKPENAVAAHCKKASTTPKQGGGFLNIIPESDVYRLVMRSNLPEAEAFQDWVVEEVLPAIRERGEYAPNQQKQVAVGVDDLIALVDRLKTANECLDLVKPKTPIGAISKITGRPRNRIVPAYPRSDRVTIEIPAEYRHLFNYLQMTNQSALLEDDADASA